MGRYLPLVLSKITLNEHSHHVGTAREGASYEPEEGPHHDVALIIDF